jgi:threonine dehydratase
MSSIGLTDIEEAATRIKDRVRRTPFLRARFLKDPPWEGEILLKLECLQVTGSFKPRGANNAVLSLTEAEVGRGIITASGGNHGLAVAYAAHAAGTRAVIYLPESAPASKAERLKAWGAEVAIEGAVYDDANEAALSRAERDGFTYIHAFADPRVIAGQGTVGLEMLKQSGHCDVFVIAIGGGGLISGIATAIKAKKPEARIIGVEPVGAPTLKESLAAGDLVTLERIDTVAGTLAPRRSAEINFEIIRENVDEIVLVDDEEMRDAARWLWFEMGIAAELSGAAGVAALRAGRIALDPAESVGLLICGAGSDGLS